MNKQSIILVVDDHFNFLESILDLLTEKGFRCIGASNGVHAIEKAKSMKFDLILMDIKMPELNGVDTYKQIKKISPKTPVVMMTAYKMDALVYEAVREGVVTVLKKPLIINQLCATFETIISSEHKEEKKSGRKTQDSDCR